MSLLLRITIGLSGAFLILMAIRSVTTRQLSEQQGLFWLFSGLGVILFGLFPGLSIWIARFFGVEYVPSIIFMIAIVIAIFGIFICFQAIANLNKRVQELAMQVSLLNKENSLLLGACRQVEMQLCELCQEASAGKERNGGV